MPLGFVLDSVGGLCKRILTQMSSIYLVWNDTSIRALCICGGWYQLALYCLQKISKVQCGLLHTAYTVH